MSKIVVEKTKHFLLTFSCLLLIK